VDVLLPRTLEEALEMKAERPDALPIAGGTDVMIEMNFDRRRPSSIMDVSRLPELKEWRREDGSLFLGAGVTYTTIMRELSSFPPLVQASRTIGSPQIRNRGTVGGNLGTASPAGDALPVLAAYDAEIVLGRAGREPRTLPWDRFLVGVKRTTLDPDELILGVRWPAITGPGSFSKIGTRNAMVIAVASLCLVVDDGGRTVRVALGSVAPTVVRARDAEATIATGLAEAGTWEDPDTLPSESVVVAFGDRVAAAATPIDDVRGTTPYRRHACRVLAQRALRWALHDRRTRAEGRTGGS
jgi:CO/xanthine dehydrogenase FAD-binding subunit